MRLTVREFRITDIEKIVDYFIRADINFLKGMGADKSKLPTRTHWIKNLQSELKKSYREKDNYYIFWLLDDEAVGHSNVNRIIFGESATMHLHLWKTATRQSGLGSHFVKLSIPFYFEKLDLKTLICEPYANNIAPNKTLKKLGFEFIKTYETIRGSICFMQYVNRYELKREALEKLKTLHLIP